MAQRGRLPSTWFAIALAAVGLAGCGQVAKGLQGLTGPRVLKSWDGAFQVTAPAGWNTNRDLHDKADLGVACLACETYLVVLSESAGDFEVMDLERHAKATLLLISSELGSARVGPARQLTIAGQPALQHEVTGVNDNVRVHYLHTTVKLGGYYHQILAWTLASRWEREQATLQAVVASFTTTARATGAP